MKKVSIIKYNISFCLCVFLLHTMTGCKQYDGYQGDYPELFTVAVNSLIGSNGYISNGEKLFDSEINLIDQDAYGRKLFTYYEDNKISTYSLLISQKNYDNYVYYYPDDCFISNEKNVFSDLDILELKEINDWGNELLETKCVKASIIRKRDKPKIKVNKDEIENLFKKIAISKDYKGADTIYRYLTYCTSDIYGRLLYYGYGVGMDAEGAGVSPNSITMYFDLMIIINSDGTIKEDNCAIELLDFYDYQDQLKQFKTLNNWNKEK